MKNILLSIALVAIASLHAQIQGPHGGEYRFNPDNVECLSHEKRQEIANRLKAARQQLLITGRLDSGRILGTHPTFQWPVTKNPTTTYNHVWSISNHVDHNQNFPNQVQDWNCGNRTYDTSGGYNHQGIDIFTWPFSWYQMANNQSWAIAAAPGIILGKDDGNADTSCAMSGGNWNAVYVLHDDGSVSWYGHLKNNSLTPKDVGEPVELGEYLGVIGSSGNSTGPHLHFEVYDSADNLVDTYAGTCNDWGVENDSWWTQQKPYVDPKINAVFTHSAPPSFPSCPQVEGTNFDNEFLVGQTVYCAGYFADQNTGVPAIFSLYRPDGTLAYSDFATSPELYYASYWYWTLAASSLSQTGTWTVTFTFAGNTLSHQFAYGTTLSAAESGATRDIYFYPNPAHDRIVFSDAIKTLTAYGIDGKSLELRVTYDKEVDVSALPNGIFMLKGTDSRDRPFTKKLIR